MGVGQTARTFDSSSSLSPIADSARAGSIEATSAIVCDCQPNNVNVRMWTLELERCPLSSHGHARSPTGSLFERLKSSAFKFPYM